MMYEGQLVSEQQTWRDLLTLHRMVDITQMMYGGHLVFEQQRHGETSGASPRGPPQHQAQNPPPLCVKHVYTQVRVYR